MKKLLKLSLLNAAISSSLKVYKKEPLKIKKVLMIKNSLEEK